MNFKSYQFIVYYRNINDDRKLYNDVSVLKEFKKIKNPCFYWCADPFPMNINGKKYIFAEMAGKFSGKGKIVYLELGNKKKKWKDVFVPKFHISFPNIFQIEDKLYAIPETYMDGCLALYSVDKYNNFSWKKEKTIIEGKFIVDTVFIKDNLEYIISYEAESNLSPNKSLLIRDRKTKKIISTLPDTQNVLRPAGNIFYDSVSCKYYFPSQNCSVIYGGGIIFNEFKMDKNNIVSIKKVSEITPAEIKSYLGIKDAVGCHTYNFNDEFEVIDIVVNRFSFIGLMSKIIHKLFPKK